MKQIRCSRRARADRFSDNPCRSSNLVAHDKRYDRGGSFMSALLECLDCGHRWRSVSRSALDAPNAVNGSRSARVR